jgi:hypothetical protein
MPLTTDEANAFFYAKEKLSRALYYLAAEDGRVQDRLTKASIELMFGFNERLPVQVREPLDTLLRELTRDRSTSVDIVLLPCRQSKQRGLWTDC